MPLVVTMAKGVLLGQAGTDDFNMGACKGDQVIFSKVACMQTSMDNQYTARTCKACCITRKTRIQVHLGITGGCEQD